MFKFAVVLFLFLSGEAFSKTKLDEAVLREYLKIQKEFNQKSCTANVEKSYKELDLKYRGDGNYIPVLVNQKVDHQTIKNNLPLLEEKISWIGIQKERLAKQENFEDLYALIKRIENEVKLLQLAKKDYFFAKTDKKKKEIETKANAQFTHLLKEINEFAAKAPFLLSFKFPLDHLGLRAEHEKAKLRTSSDARVKANSMYFHRRIVQDGSFDVSLTRNDSSIRSAFDTLYLSLNKNPNRSFLTENERSDFNFVFYNFKLLLDQGPKLLNERMDLWQARSQRSLAFYKNLMVDKNINPFAEAEISLLLEDRAKALLNLKEFVLEKEAETYKFWSTKSELFQYLYVLETILYAEVGRIDAPDALERRDVAQVVINRFSRPEYNKILETDGIFSFLDKSLKLDNHKWLNLLFKEGEFSFTYFYIPGNFHIYCPDMSKVGQFLRKENLRIAMELYNKPRKNFDALRYFSRMSMFGRIEMDTLWKDYQPLVEVPGRPAKNAKKLAEQFKKDLFKFYYTFESQDKKKTYMVVEMNKKVYVVDGKNPKQIYNYRNPHHFRYFSPIK